MGRKWVVAGLGLLMGLAGWPVAEGVAAPLLYQSFGSLQEGSIPGQLLTVHGKRTWRAGGRGEEYREVARGLRYPVQGNVLPEQGTIEMVLYRDNKRTTENLFAFADSSGGNRLNANMVWDMIGRGEEHPTLVFNTPAGSPRVWYNDQSDPFKYGADSLLFPEIAIGRPIPRGSRLHLAFTWGERPQDCAVYLNGRKQAAHVAQPFGFADAVREASHLVIGGLPEQGMKGDNVPLNSPLVSFMVSDQPLVPSQFLLQARIRSLTHNAGSVSKFSGFLVEGETLTVTMEANAGGIAACDIGDIRNLPLAEDADKPGRYNGTYTVAAGDFVEKGSVVGRFRNLAGVEADPYTAQRKVNIDGRVHLAVKLSNDLVPADRKSKVGITVVATDANGKKLGERPLRLTLSTTDEYTGMVGSGTFEDMVGGKVETDWGGVTDAFGEVTAQYQAGFAAKTAVINAKDLLAGGIGFGVVRSFIQGNVDIAVREPAVRRLQALRGTMEVSVSRDWLTADGSSRSRITARVMDAEGKPIEGDQISFILMGDRGQVRVIQGRTDSSGKAFADYIAGIIIGQVQIEVRDLDLGLTAMVAIELRADAPAEVLLRAEPAEVFVGGTGTTITAQVRDVNGNPNSNTEVGFDLLSGQGALSVNRALTDAREGKASVSFTPGRKAGTATVRATVTSRTLTEAEMESARGAVFFFGLDKDPGALTLREWKVEAKEQVVKGQELAVLEDREGAVYLVKAPRDGVLSVREVETGDDTRMGDTLAYVMPVSQP